MTARKICIALLLIVVACRSEAPRPYGLLDVKIDHLMENLQGPEVELSSAARHGQLGDESSRRNLALCAETLEKLEQLQHPDSEFRRLNQLNLAAVKELQEATSPEARIAAWHRVERACAACHQVYQ
jgi:hypothetical protein